MSYSEDNSFEKIMERMLANPKLTDVDKRVGSVIYDALAPTAMELADAYVKMDILEEQTYLLTATGKNLDKRVYDYGIKRIQAIQSQRIGSFKKYKLNAEGQIEKDEGGNPILIDMDIPEGTRFAVPGEKLEITYTYSGIKDGNKILICDQFGTIGNGYEGLILPLDNVNGLIQAKLIGTYIPANDTETDNELRERTMISINKRAFGGNIADYIEYVKDIDGAGNCKIFPAWQHNGSVLLSVVDSQYNPASKEFQTLIKQKIDPEEKTGQGVGIAPIGHYVTITTPQKKMVTINMKVTLEDRVTVGNVRESIVKEIEKYFDLTRREFKQDKTLAIYLSRIIDYTLNVKGVVNVSSVTLNGKSEDIIYTDTSTINGQSLPYVQEVIIA